MFRHRHSSMEDIPLSRLRIARFHAQSFLGRDVWVKLRRDPRNAKPLHWTILDSFGQGRSIPYWVARQWGKSPKSFPHVWMDRMGHLRRWPHRVICYSVSRHSSVNTGWDKHRFIVLSTWNTKFILILLFINCRIIVHILLSHPVWSMPPTFPLQSLATVPWLLVTWPSVFWRKSGCCAIPECLPISCKTTYCLPHSLLRGFDKTIRETGSSFLIEISESLTFAL